MPEVHLIRGGFTVRYDIASDRVDGAAVALTETWPTLPATFAGGIDAAVNYGNGKAYLFRGAGYVRLDIAAGTVETEERAIGTYWRGTGEAGFAAGLDAAVNAGNGFVYLFRGRSFASYDVAADQLTGVGELSAWRLSTDGWFDAGVDAAVNYGDGNLYFFRGDRYVRYDLASGSVAAAPRLIGDYWTGTREVGFTDTLRGSWCTADPAGRRPVVQPDAPPDATAAGGFTPYRVEVLRQLEHFKGAVEGTELFASFMAPQTLADARAARPGYTTCVDFQQQVYTRAAAQLGLAPTVKVLGVFARQQVEAANVGAWHPAVAGGTDRPRPGDVYMLVKADGSPDFSHTGHVVSVTDNGDGTELWTTVDGGQGRAPSEMIAEVRRVYHPDTTIITGEANQGPGLRRVDGWIDIDRLVHQ